MLNIIALRVLNSGDSRGRALKNRTQIIWLEIVDYNAHELLLRPSRYIRHKPLLVLKTHGSENMHFFLSKVVFCQFKNPAYSKSYLQAFNHILRRHAVFFAFTL